MRTPAKPTLQQQISAILIQLQTRWDRLTKAQVNQWTAYADFRFISETTDSASRLSGRQLFILQNFYRVFYGPLNGLGKNPIMQVPVFAPPEYMEIWGPKGEWSNKDIIRYPFPLNIKTHFAIIWESPPLPSEALAKDGPLPSEGVLTPLPSGGAGGGLSLMSFTTLNGRDQDTTIPYREQFGNIPKAGQYIFAKVGFANKITGVVSNFIFQKQKVVPNP